MSGQVVVMAVRGQARVPEPPPLANTAQIAQGTLGSGKG